MNAKSIIGIILGIILLNNGLYTIIPLPGVISTLAIIVAAILLFMDSTKGGMLGTGNDIEATRELIFQDKLVNAIFAL